MGRSIKFHISIPIILGFILLFAINSCQEKDRTEPLSLHLFRRSVLDQKPRMISLQYDSAHFLAYDLKNMLPYQFWTGGVLWNGAAFNNIKTIQPSSYGNIYRQWNDSIGHWKYVVNDQPVEFGIQFKSYEILKDSQIVFNYQLKSGDDLIEISEAPKIFSYGDSISYQRDFSVASNNPGVKVYFDETEVLNGSSLLMTFGREEAVDRPAEITSDNGAQYWLDRSGCNTCHQISEQNIGPAYLMIADRYDGTEEVRKMLMQNVRNGSTGKWGQAQMIPHPDLAGRDLQNMIRYILSLKPDDSPRKANSKTDLAGEVVYHPGFGAPLDGIHPSFDLIKIRPENFKPRVAGMRFTDDGDLLVSTWDSLGAVYKISNLSSNDPNQIKIKMIASGLAEPLGIDVVEKDIYVMQKHELTQLIDRDGDGSIDVYACFNNDFGVTPDFHEFSYGLIHHQGKFYGSLGLAMRLMSSELQNEDRGTVFSVDDQGNFEILARGLRQPNGIGLGPEDEIFVTENQGQWVPACKLIQVERDHFYGCQFGTGDRFKEEIETIPAVYLPQDEIGNSPGEPILLKKGPYAGQMIFGDVTHGGIKRAFLEKINGVYQGCVFRFTQGMEAGINRIDLDKDGNIYAGGVGMNGGWAHKEHQFGLEKLAYNGKSTFEIHSINISPEGFVLNFSTPMSREINFDRSNIKISQWRYEATERYGGPKIDLQDLPVEGIIVSDDRKQVKLVVPHIKEGYVVYFLLDHKLIDENGQQLWTGESWYTVKSIPGRNPSL